LATLVFASLLEAALAAPPASAADSFTFHGSGYGHGLGMSQWGAYGLALDGWTYTRILTHFYSDTNVRKAAQPPSTIRVGLTSDRTLVHVKAKNGPVRIRLNGPTGKVIAKIAMNQTWTVKAVKSGFAIRDLQGALVGGKTWGGPAFPLFLSYSDTGARVLIPEADAIWGTGFTYAHGFVQMGETGCPDRCRQRAVLEVPFEQYLLGIGEVPSSWPPAALKAQVVAARTYALYKIRTYGLRPDCDCHVLDGSGDQVYVGWSKEAGEGGNRWRKAVESTESRVVTYGGSVIQAFFTASDGGHTENVEDAWHGGDPTYAIPYLRGVCDPGEYTSANPWTDWERSYSASELTTRLAGYTGNIGMVKRVVVDRRGSSGRVISARVIGTTASASLTGGRLRGALGLPDTRVWINSDRNIVGMIRAEYDRLSCRPGLPTSAVMTFDAGARQKFQTGGIFRNSIKDVTVWLKGPTYDAYLAQGGAMGFMGLPTSPVRIISSSASSAAAGSCARCTRTDFQGGKIWWKSGVGAHAIWGRVLGAYLARGGAGGALGFPTTDVRTSPKGVDWARFEVGTIRCPAGRDCRVVTG
jgi:SpoIID/LytB domain protein